MKEYPLRISMELYRRIKSESISRGLNVSDMIRELLEIGLLEIMRKERENGKIKFK